MAGLTDVAIKKAKAAGRSYKMSDQGGLYLFVTPAGSKLWRYKYRFNGKEKLMSLGSYPLFSLSEAREKHLEARKLLAEGIDPTAKKKAEEHEEKSRAENSFKQVALRWHEQWKTDKSDRHALAMMRRMEADIFPAIGAKYIDDVKVTDLVQIVKAVEARGANEIAGRVLGMCGKVFRHGIAHGVSSNNPAAMIKPSDLLKTTVTTNYARVDAKDLPKLLVKIDGYEGTAITKLAMRLMSLTFLRTAEMIEMPWSEVDLDAAIIDIPKERMKGPQAHKVPHIVPLSRQAVEVLKALKMLTGNYELVFPGDANKMKPMSNNTLLMMLRRIGYRGAMTGHGWRGIASTVLNESGRFDEKHIEMQLAHRKRNKVAAAYNKAEYLAQRRIMLQWWADFLDEQRAKGRQAKS